MSNAAPSTQTRAAAAAVAAANTLPPATKHELVINITITKTNIHTLTDTRFVALCSLAALLGFAGAFAGAWIIVTRPDFAVKVGRKALQWKDGNMKMAWQGCVTAMEWYMVYGHWYFYFSCGVWTVFLADYFRRHALALLTWGPR